MCLTGLRGYLRPDTHGLPITFRTRARTLLTTAYTIGIRPARGPGRFSEKIEIGLQIQIEILHTLSSCLQDCPPSPLAFSDAKRAKRPAGFSLSVQPLMDAAMPDATQKRARERGAGTRRGTCPQGRILEGNVISL